MQRLFSTFPNSWPGLGLLVLRSAIALSLPLAPIWQDETAHWLIIIKAASMLISGLLIIGAWTPVIAFAACLYELAQIAIDRTALPSTLLLTAFIVAMALLGPGAWSLDAMLYGRKRIELGGRDQNDKSSQ